MGEKMVIYECSQVGPGQGQPPEATAQPKGLARLGHVLHSKASLTSDAHLWGM